MKASNPEEPSISASSCITPPDKVPQATPKSKPDFQGMRLKDIKEFVSARGVQVSKYNKHQLVTLANALYSMDLPIDPDYENDALDCCLDKRLTLPAGKKVPDPFQMKNLINDFSQLPSFGLIDIFNHLIMSKADYDKQMLSSWRSFDEYSLCQDGHVQYLGLKTVRDCDGSTFSIIVGKVLPTQKEKTPEGEQHYRLWFILSPNGSVHSAFCRCKGGADQGCRHLGAALFELDDFLSNERCSVTSVPAYWQPKTSPVHKPVPLLEMKISHTKKKGKRKREITPFDDSWIYSFDPSPKRHRENITQEEKVAFAKQLKLIDPQSGILDFLPTPMDDMDLRKTENIVEYTTKESVSKLSIWSKAKTFVQSKTEMSADLFLMQCKFSKDDQKVINDATLGQYKNETWHEMRHLMVTGKKIKALYTRQKTLEKNPTTDVSLTLKNFITEKDNFMTKFPIAIEYGLQKEEDAKYCYSKVCGKKHSSFQLEEPGLLVSLEHPWLGASLDGIRRCSCCGDGTLVECKCPYNGKDLDPKSAFLLESVGGIQTKDGNQQLHQNHIHYFQVQTGMAVAGLKKCDFVTYTSKGIHIIEIHFNSKFWESVVTKVKSFYINQIIPAILQKIETSAPPCSTPSEG